MKSRSGTSARETIVLASHIGLIISPTLDRCAHAEEQNVKKAQKLGCVFTIREVKIATWQRVRQRQRVTSSFARGESHLAVVNV